MAGTRESLGQSNRRSASTTQRGVRRLRNERRRVSPKPVHTAFRSTRASRHVHPEPVSSRSVATACGDERQLEARSACRTVSYMNVRLAKMRQFRRAGRAHKPHGQVAETVRSAPASCHRLERRRTQVGAGGSCARSRPTRDSRSDLSCLPSTSGIANCCNRRAAGILRPGLNVRWRGNHGSSPPQSASPTSHHGDVSIC